MFGKRKSPEPPPGFNRELSMTDEEMNPHSVLSFICAEALRLYEELIYPPRFLTQEDNVTSQATLTEEYLVALQDASKRSTSFVIVRAESYNHALTLPGVYLTNAKP